MPPHGRYIFHTDSTFENEHDSNLSQFIFGLFVYFDFALIWFYVAKFSERQKREFAKNENFRFTTAPNILLFVSTLPRKIQSERRVLLCVNENKRTQHKKVKSKDSKLLLLAIFADFPFAKILAIVFSIFQWICTPISSKLPILNHRNL